MATEQLLPHTDAQHGLPQILDKAVELVLAQVFHAAAGLALSGKHHAVGTEKLLLVVGNERFHSQAAQCVDHGVDVSGVVFYYCYLH